jgi:small GTP-binding protein
MNGEEIKDIKIILVGMSGTGKTNMIYALTDQKFTADSLTTTSSTFVEKFETINNKKYRLEIWDTAGQEKFRSLTKLFVKDAKVVVFVYDITSMESFQDLDYWIKTIYDILGDDPILGLAGNKSDLYQNEEVKDEIGEQKAKEMKAKFKIVSAKTGQADIQEFVNELVVDYIKKIGEYNDNNNKKKGDKLKTKSQQPKKKNCC